MNKRLTLGSLFDGSGGFTLGGLLCGVEPLWASEVEPFPIRVTTKRLPQVQHLGDINKIDGSQIPPVDIITAGFCCQDLSVAGKRAGLHGERSGLFFQIIRIIKEMRQATNGAHPTYAVLENVPGMYSSRGGADFMEVLNELIQVKDETVSIPLPTKGKWSTSGEIVGDGFSVAWRTLDAQFWGVAQRRRRCYIVVDFADERAGKILFDETCLRWNPASGEGSRESSAGNSEAGIGITGFDGYNGAIDEVAATLGVNCGVSTGRNGVMSAAGVELGAASRLGGHYWEEYVGALKAHAGDNQTAVVYPINTQVGLRNHKDGDGTGLGVGDSSDPAYTLQNAHSHAVCVENRPQDGRVKIKDDGICQTLDARMGMGGGNVPLVMNERQYAMTVGEDLANTLTGTDFKGVQLTAYGICSQSSNSMKSANPHSGIYQAETARTLDTTSPDPNKNAGGMAVVAVEGNGSRPSHRGDGYGGEVSFTLNSVERHSVCYQDQVGALCASDYKFPQNQQVEEGKVIVENHQHSGYREVGVAGTLKSHGGTNGGGSENMVVENKYVVRRLTPTECALLQGFPPDWCENLETPEPTEAEIEFWANVWETHRKILGKSKKPKTRNQLLKWLKDPHSDSAEYKMWGNGVALPCVVFVLGGIVRYSRI